MECLQQWDYMVWWCVPSAKLCRWSFSYLCGRRHHGNLWFYCFYLVCLSDIATYKLSNQSTFYIGSLTVKTGGRCSKLVEVVHLVFDHLNHLNHKKAADRLCWCRSHTILIGMNTRFFWCLCNDVFMAAIPDSLGTPDSQWSNTHWLV